MTFTGNNTEAWNVTYLNNNSPLSDHINIKAGMGGYFMPLNKITITLAIIGEINRGV